MDNLQIIYQDEAILVVDKPPGLVVTTSESHTGPTLEDFLLEYHNKDIPDRMGIVHRLDKDTSGVLLVAKTQAALENLQAQFKNRSIKKEYLALVHGLVKESGKVEGSIGRNPVKHDKFAILEEVPLRQGFAGRGREAVTEYEPVERLQITGEQLAEIFPDFNKVQVRRLSTLHYSLFTLLACRPKTGRTHQIRVHLKYKGFPIVSDEKYGGRKMSRLDIRWCPRMFLHAKRLGFFHPGSGKWMEMEAPLPEDLKRALQMLTDNEYQ